MTTITILDPVTPTEQEAALARESSRRLSRYGRKDLTMRTTDGDEVTLPAPAVQLLVRLLVEMANGNAVTLTPIHAELTTQQAADLLGVSRPFLIKQLEDGLIPYRNVGAHRRILLKDVIDYKRDIDAKRLEVLAELVKLGQEMDMGY